MTKLARFFVVALIVATPTIALAQTVEVPAAPEGPQTPKTAPKPGEAVPNIGGVGPRGKGQKGDPGMMGQPWPQSPEEASKTIGNLLAHLATEGDALTAGAVAASIEKLWRLSGGDTVNLLVDRGEQATARNELEKALKILDAAVDLAPDYADAWNRRAYVHFRMGNSGAALGDLRRALALDPNHFRALDGMAKILETLGEKKAALQAYDQLLKIHPQIEGAQEAADKLRKEIEGQGI